MPFAEVKVQRVVAVVKVEAIVVEVVAVAVVAVAIISSGGSD